DGLCHVFDDDASGRGASSQGRGERGGQNRPKGQGFGPQRGGRGRGEGDYGASVAGGLQFASAGTMNSGIGGRPWEWNRRASRGRGSYRGGWRGDRWRVGVGYDRGCGSGPGRGEGRGRGDGGYGGGRGGRGRPRTFRIQNYVDCDSADELTMRLTGSITEFKEFVDDVFMDPKDATKLLKILEKVVSSDLHRESVQNILVTTCTSYFLDTHLTNLITHLRSNMDLDVLFDSKVEETAETIQRMHLLLTHVCRKLPSYASKGSLLLTFLNSQHHIISFLRQHRPSLEKDLQDLKEECDRAMTMMHDVSQRQETGARSKRGPNEDDEIPPEDFNTLPIFPEGRDMDWSEKPFLRSNKAEGAFKDVHHYLDVQFRLLREDYIRPLREGIREYRRMREKGEQVKKNSDLRLYHRVQVIGLACKEALEHRVHFDISHMKHVRWESSKRLLYGSLVCLSVDDFENISFAIVTNRDIKDLENGIVQIRFESGIEDVLDSTAGDVFTMAETTAAYFEAYRHVLEGLQEMQQNFPLAPYIVECQKNVKPPKYVYSSGGLATMDLRSLLHERSLFPASDVSVVNPKMWPPLEETKFDESQYKAVQTALTKELAIIHGPPGTGKTYVGLKVAKVLLENRHVWNPTGESLPILVVCYTNHALDQFLEGILEFLPQGIVRVGGHCKNPSLEEFNLKQIRSQIRREKKTSLSVHNSIKDCFKALCGLKEQVERVSSRLEASTKGVVSEKALQYTMPDYHYQSLVSRPSYDGMGKPLSVMMDWLTSDMTSWDQEMDTVMYGQLVEEVMSQILEGSDTSFDMATVSQDNIHSLHPKVRAQLYRSWKDRADHQLQQQVETAVAAGKDPTQFVELQDLASHEILPDSVLLGAVHRTLYVAIRARILQLQPTRKQNQYGQQDPSDYCIRTWLGIPWSPDLGALQDTLDQLTEDDPEAGDEDKLNVEEEADLVQRERQLDDDDDRDLFDFGVRKSYTVKDAMADLGVVDAKPKRGQAAGPGGWMMTPQQKKQQAKKIQHLLKSATAMTEAEARRVTNVWSTSLKLQDRARLYLYWLQRYQRDLKNSIKLQADDYAKETKRMRELRFGEDQEILREATVIGMTTTGAARYRKVLTSVACPIVMLEEAARSCQHLILIGDHQQLRPSLTVHELCRNYQLDLSLFERLVKNELPHSTLGVQHRMRPEVAELVRHIYPHLQDHDTTLNRPHIRGLEKDVFLLHHEVAEERHDETRSKSNSHEAELCVGLCRYLLQQGYDPKAITILAAYYGQVLAIRSLVEKNKMYQGVYVTTVDNFQQEQNEIIILSLVRSNEQGSVGFLSTDNRVCVALSRARNGMYAFGNFKLLAEKSELWKNITKTAKQHGQMSDVLVLRCENHPGQEIRVSTAKDFDSAPEGGCKRPCETRLACSHHCELPCHAYDRGHERYKCRKKCERKLCDKGHPCTKKCHEECGKCLYKVEKTVPVCGHAVMTECSRDPHEIRCASRCEGRLPCGHQCSGKCGECRQKNKHLSLCTEEDCDSTHEEGCKKPWTERFACSYSYDQADKQYELGGGMEKKVPACGDKAVVECTLENKKENSEQRSEPSPRSSRDHCLSPRSEDTALGNTDVVSVAGATGGVNSIHLQRELHSYDIVETTDHLSKTVEINLPETEQASEVTAAFQDSTDVKRPLCIQRVTPGSSCQHCGSGLKLPILMAAVYGCHTPIAGKGSTANVIVHVWDSRQTFEDVLRTFDLKYVLGCENLDCHKPRSPPNTARWSLETQDTEHLCALQGVIDISHVVAGRNPTWNDHDDVGKTTQLQVRLELGEATPNISAKGAVCNQTAVPCEPASGLNSTPVSNTAPHLHSSSITSGFHQTNDLHFHSGGTFGSSLSLSSVLHNLGGSDPILTKQCITNNATGTVDRDGLPILSATPTLDTESLMSDPGHMNSPVDRSSDSPSTSESDTDKKIPRRNHVCNRAETLKHSTNPAVAGDQLLAMSLYEASVNGQQQSSPQLQQAPSQLHHSPQLPQTPQFQQSPQFHQSPHFHQSTQLQQSLQSEQTRQLQQSSSHDPLSPQSQQSTQFQTSFQRQQMPQLQQSSSQIQQPPQFQHPTQFQPPFQFQHLPLQLQPVTFQTPSMQLALPYCQPGQAAGMQHNYMLPMQMSQLSAIVSSQSSVASVPQAVQPIPSQTQDGRRHQRDHTLTRTRRSRSKSKSTANTGHKAASVQASCTVNVDNPSVSSSISSESD
ncbi:hypothetical protein BaRGS_00011036, partial [Batillaria attramentaria]